MPTLWFIAVAFMLTMYVLLDGFDLGAGAIHLFVAKTEEERRTVLRAIGPLWDGNEVWLIASGGTLFFAFPLLYASGFSGFYLPLIMVLWLLMARAMAIELRAHLPNPVWSAFWDGAFAFASILLALFFGVALANVIRGVPLDAHGYFFEALWTNWSPKTTAPGVLDWYTVLIGALSLATLVVHGAAFIALKTTGALQRRALEAARRTWPFVAALTAVSTVATFWIRPSMATRFSDHPLAYLLPLLALLGLIGAGVGAARRSEQLAFAASCAFIAGMLSSTVYAIYPRVLPAVVDARSLTIDNAAAPQQSLTVGLYWWPVAIAMAVIYFVVTYKLFWGKVPSAAGQT